MKLIEIVNGFNSINSLVESNKIGFKLAWDLEDLLEVLKKPYERYHKERLKLLEKFGSKKEEGESVFLIATENLKSFNKEIVDLETTEIEIDFKKIDFNDLFSSDIKLESPAKISHIKPFVKK